MGVHGLWDLLAPVGRRVSVETLSGKKLAIDASIWMIQFMKAMRDETGEMVRNAHLLGFFRRICKLLYLRTKPVFVFDGGTPALKRRTVIARRRQRENAQAKIRKTAEKMLLNHLKTMRLKELAKDLENQRTTQKNDAQGKKILSDENHVEESNLKDADSESYDQEKLDEMLAASIAAEEDGSLNSNALPSAAVAAAGEAVDSDENEEIILDSGNRNENSKNSAKLKEVLLDHLTEMEESNLERNDMAAGNYNQEKLDEMLAASIAAKEDDRSTKTASTSTAAIPYEESVDEDEEMILPALSGKVDPAVLAALPPSMQLDLLVQMRERLMAENRQKYQKVKKAPEKFSELQIEAYLKTVAFRREIDQVQKAAAGKDVGGVQTSRIASEANREYIFSSSFMGDKQLLASAGVQMNGNEQQRTPRRHPPSDSINENLSTSKSGDVAGLVPDESGRVFEDDVETYLDERGRIRVSRVRAMGIRMTRDLQRNLDLMKEIERERTQASKTRSAQSDLIRDDIGSAKRIPSKEQPVKSSQVNYGGSVNLNERNDQSILDNERSVQISFEVDDEGKSFDNDDDIFASLVAGQPVTISSSDHHTLGKQASDSASDSDWEEGIIEDRGNSSCVALETNCPLKESKIYDDSDVEWEEGIHDVHDNSSLIFESGNPASRGHLEEEADLQEAIRRSLEDFGGEKFDHTPSQHEKLISTEENPYKGVPFLDQEDNTDGLNLPEKNVILQNEQLPRILASAELDNVDQNDALQVFSSSERQLKLSEEYNPNNIGILNKKTYERDSGSSTGQSSQDMPSAESAADLETKETHKNVGLSSSTLVQGFGLSTSSKIYTGHDSHTCKAVSDIVPFAINIDNVENKMESSMLINEEKRTESPYHSVEMTNSSMPIMEPSKDSTVGTDVEPNLASNKQSNTQLNENSIDKFGRNENLQANYSEASLQEEMLVLGQERLNLGDEQKKFERNAESVSSEMFAECQELLQMFGIPYIIAPMEAEAQCAYMELASLVDGVVTDDSDVFLFGGRSVYKNIFDDRKYVETYFMKDIEKELGLTREKLIRMALLLGSDYTEGISGIGIVNAIEVVNAFPEEDGLKKFREWIESPDPTILGKFDAQNGSNVRKKGSKVGDNGSNRANCNLEEINSFDHNVDHSEDHILEIRQIFMDNHRNVSKNWHLPSAFPCDAVISAYSGPQVDNSTEPFSWGRPDLQVLRRLCWEKFGWAIQKSDELLLPVLNEYNKHETQLRLEAFYTFNERFAKIRSKRIRKAVKAITGNQPSELIDDAVKEFSESGKKRSAMSGDKKPDTHSKRGKGATDIDTLDSVEKSARKQSRGRRTGEPVLSRVEVDGRQSIHGGSHGDKRGKGRGRDRGGKGRGRGRGRGKGSLGCEQSDSDSDDVSELEDHVEKSESSQQLRRSMRSMRPASYNMDDMEIDDVDNPQDQNDKMSDEEAVEPGLFGGSCRDAGTTLNGKEQHKMEDPLPKDLSKGYFEEEGGFFSDEDADDQAGVNQNSNPCEDDVSEDFLKMGGGFCMEESETGIEQDAVHSPSRVPVCSSGIIEEADCGKGLVSDVEKTLNDIGDGERPNVFDTEPKMNCVNATDANVKCQAGSTVPESTESNNGRSSARSLSTMPFLKRKRRKS